MSSLVELFLEGKREGGGAITSDRHQSLPTMHKLKPCPNKTIKKASAVECGSEEGEP